MKELSKVISQNLKKAIIPNIEKGPRGWPPTCDTYVYQSKRPYYENSKEKDEK